MGRQEFWRTIPRLVPSFLRIAGATQHFIPVSFQPATPPASDPYTGVTSGRKPRTKLENKLDHVQACYVAELQALVDALAKAMVHGGGRRRRRENPPTLDDLLKSVFPGPSDASTLLRKGKVYIRDRDANWRPNYRGYLTTEKAKRLSAAGDIEAIKALIAAHVTTISLIGRARSAAQHTAQGFRATLIEIAKGKRRDDETIARDMLDHLPHLFIMEMTAFSFVSGINASHIWQCYHGAPYTIDYHRVFDLAVFAGRLSRGEPAPMTWDLVRYFLAHRTAPNIRQRWKVLLFPKTVAVHDAIEWIRAQIDQAYGLAAFTGGLILCDQPGESRTFRLPPLTR